jgi:sialic acid synthase SpsE
MSDEPSKIKEMEKRIRQLEKALSDSQLKVIALETEKEVYEAYLSLQEVKKNSGSSKSTPRSKK